MALAVGKVAALGAAALAGILLLFSSKKAKASPAPEPVPIPVPPIPSVPPVVKPCPPLLSGEIASAQAKLNLAGMGPIAVDGSFGPMTSAAATKFQQAQGLPVTGCLDPATLYALAPYVVTPAPAEEYVDSNGLHWQISNPSTGVWQGLYVDTPIAEYGGTPTIIVRNQRDHVVIAIDQWAATHPVG